MKIIFDFDHTVFNTLSMHEDIIVAMETLGVSEEKYQRVYEDVTYWKMFNVDAFANRLERLFAVSSEDVVQALSKITDRSELYVYDDVKDNAKELISAGHEMYLLSWGDEEWEKNKIDNSGISSYFKKVVTVSKVKVGYLGEWCCGNTGIVLINDKPAELKVIKEMHSNFNLIRLKRPGGKFSDQPTPDGVMEAKSMAEVVKLIEKIKPEEIKHLCLGCTKQREPA